MRPLRRSEKKKELIKRGSKLLSKANRAWKRGDMKAAVRFNQRFHTIEKRLKRV